MSMSRFPRSTPEAQGLSSTAISAFVDALEREVDCVHSLTLLRHGHVVAEGWWEPYRRHDPHALFSLSKSFTSSAIGLLVVCVGLVFRFVPNVRVTFRDVWPGAVLTALLWRLAFAFFSWYASDLSRWTVHGSVAAVVVFLLWIYVSAVLLLYGVEMTAAYVRLRAVERRQQGLGDATA